jgi:hypothetical protein
MLSLQSTTSKQDEKRSHEHSLDVLHNVHSDRKTSKAMETLEERGCHIGYESSWAPIPLELVKAVTIGDIILAFFLGADCTISSLMHDGPKTEACIGG